MYPYYYSPARGLPDQHPPVRSHRSWCTPTTIHLYVVSPTFTWTQELVYPTCTWWQDSRFPQPWAGKGQRPSGYSRLPCSCVRDVPWEATHCSAASVVVLRQASSPPVWCQSCFDSYFNSYYDQLVEDTCISFFTFVYEGSHIWIIPQRRSMSVCSTEKCIVIASV